MDAEQEDGHQQDFENQTQDDTNTFEQLKETCFPAAIVALPQITRLIETFSMTPADALIQATRSGEAERVQERLGRFEYDISSGLVEAAGRGDEVIAGMLLVTLAETEEVGGDIVDAIERSGKAAAENGHLRVADMFFREIRYYCRSLMPILDMMNAAAANGHLDVVKLKINHAEQGGFVDEFCRFPTSDTLSRAVTGGHPDVVDFLVTHRNLRWNLKEAFIAAMKQGDDALEEKIYILYAQQYPGKDLIVELALFGCKDAVKYLYNKGHNDPALVDEALKSAAAGNQTDVVEFLENICRSNRLELQ
ncbi:hypothetical protein ON010_g8373 [Phytophthora cinnamomi]|nr:hypothetical protein ON010_g8373 [Phytophthora cinnamomi]